LPQSPYAAGIPCRSDGRGRANRNGERELKRLRDCRVEDGGYLLDLEIVIAAAERSHLVALPLLGLQRHVAGLRVLHLTVFFHTLEVLRSTPPSIYGPLRPAAQHLLHFVFVEADRTSAAYACGDARIKRAGKLLLHLQDIGAS
jgi:hypothetical protein